MTGLRSSVLILWSDTVLGTVDCTCGCVVNLGTVGRVTGVQAGVGGD